MTRSFGNETDPADLERLRSALEASGDLVYDWDLATDCLSWVGRAASLFGPQADAVPGSGDVLNGRINPEDLPGRMQVLSEHFAGGRAYDFEYRVRAGDGAFHWVHDRGAVQHSGNGTPVRVCGTLRLVTQRREQQTRLEHLANYDELTGHYNKLRLREALDYALAYGQRYDHPGAFLAVGADQLDRINMAYGPEAGDAVLIAVGQCLDDSLRATDIIGRLGSDRYGVVLSVCSAEDAVRIAERITDCVRDRNIVIGDGEIHATVSIGVVHFPDQAKTGFDAIAKAEGALLKAKSAGRDCVECYRLSEEQRQGHRASMELGEQVAAALKDNRLVFAFQPVVDATTHQVRYHECLLRMITPDDEVISAGQFVPVVERLGLMRALDRRALELALSELEAHPGIILAFNISGVTAADRGWLRSLVAKLKDRHELASRLLVEITETAALHDLEDSARFISVVRDLGCQVAVDDFGAGYTTFRHLKTLTVDVVKIDGSFVRNLSQSKENQLFIRNLLSLARSFNLVTVAEFVENLEDAKILTDEGVGLLQGYYFGKPELNPPWRAQAAPPAPRRAVGRAPGVERRAGR